MSNLKIRGNEYDLSRCTRDQLQSYVADVLRGTNAITHYPTGTAVIETALVPPERQADVALELAQYCESALPLNRPYHPIGVETSVTIREIVERFRKATP